MNRSRGGCAVGMCNPYLGHTRCPAVPCLFSVTDSTLRIFCYTHIDRCTSSQLPAVITAARCGDTTTSRNTPFLLPPHEPNLILTSQHEHRPCKLSLYLRLPCQE